jgi:hypothetical protein
VTKTDLENYTFAYWRFSSNLSRERRREHDPAAVIPAQHTDESADECVDELRAIAKHSDSARLRFAAVNAISPALVPDQEQACESSV